MQANQKLEAEAGALRALLLEFLALNAAEAGLPIAESRLACPEFCDKIRAALAVTDAGKEVAECITGYQEQLKLNTRLIELLRDSRTSFMAQVNSFLEIIKSPASSFVENDAEQHVAMKVLRAVQFRFANLHAHRYADLLSMATRFSLRNDGEGPYIEKSIDDWLISRRGIGTESEDVLWDRVAEAWGIFDHRIEEHFVFATLEAAFAYVEDHPAVLGLQSVDNAPNSVLDSIQPHR